MIELHRADILEPVADPGLQLGIAGRHEAAVHQWKRVVDEPRMQPGDKAARDNRQRHQADDPLRAPPPARRDLRPRPLKE